MLNPSPRPSLSLCNAARSRYSLFEPRPEGPASCVVGAATECGEQAADHHGVVDGRAARFREPPLKQVRRPAGRGRADHALRSTL